MHFATAVALVQLLPGAIIERDGRVEAEVGKKPGGRQLNVRFYLVIRVEMGLTARNAFGVQRQRGTVETEADPLRP